MRPFLGLSDFAVFHCMVYLFILGSYWKTKVSSPVIICLRMSKTSLIFFSKFSQNLTWLSFWSSDKILGTIFAHTFYIPRSCSRIVRTDSLFRLSLSDIICTVNLQSLYTSCFTFVIFSSVLIVEGRPVSGSSFTSLRPFSKHLCHSKICVLDITSSP